MRPDNIIGIRAILIICKSSHSKRTPDINVIAAAITEQATDEAHIVKNPAAVALGRLGGLTIRQQALYIIDTKQVGLMT
jgi:hypothetical protein